MKPPVQPAGRAAKAPCETDNQYVNEFIFMSIFLHYDVGVW